jgi:hypothetical protein
MFSTSATGHSGLTSRGSSIKTSMDLFRDQQNKNKDRRKEDLEREIASIQQGLPGSGIDSNKYAASRLQRLQMELNDLS